LEAYIASLTLASELRNYNGEGTVVVTPKGRMREINLESRYIDFMRESHIFELDGRIARLFLLTKNKPRPGIKLPFPNTFIDVVVRFDSKIFYGFLAIETRYSYVNGTPISNAVTDANHIGEDEFEDITIYTFYKDEKTNKKGVFRIGMFWKADYDLLSTKEMSKSTIKRLDKFMRCITMNFIDFIHDPNVRLIEHRRTRQTNEKRMKKGKIPLPSSTVIKLTGEVAKYVDDLRLDNGNGFAYDHKFWVKGHWRELTSPRFTKKRYQRVWIPPYIKGQGILIEKRYKIPITKFKKERK
jgi:hypothetical protein